RQMSDIAGYVLLLICVAFFAWVFLSRGWTATERNHLRLIAVLFLGYAVFSAVFEQAGSTLNLFADRNTRNRLFGWGFPSSWFQLVNPLFIILFAPMFAWLWVALGRRKAEPGSITKFGAALVLVGIGFAVLVPPAARQGVLASPNWLILTYLLH